MFLAKCSLKHFDSNSERREEGKGDREGGREEGRKETFLGCTY